MTVAELEDFKRRALANEEIWRNIFLLSDLTAQQIRQAGKAAPRAWMKKELNVIIARIAREYGLL